MMNLKNTLKKYFENYGRQFAGAGLMLTGDVVGAAALNEIEK